MIEIPHYLRRAVQASLRSWLWLLWVALLLASYAVTVAVTTEHRPTTMVWERIDAH